MRAILVEDRNDPGQLRDVPVPEPAKGEILVRVRAAGINPIDWKTRDNAQRPFPFVLGQDVAGVVTAVGPGVTGYAVDDRIFGIARTHGGYADFTIAYESEPAQPAGKIPDSVSDVKAAALPTPGLTALAAVERMRIAEGQVFFVVGVTGTLGQIAAQIARNRGARVAGSGAADGADAVRSLGLEAYVAYDRADVPSEIRKRYPDGVDALLDLADDAEKLEAVAVAVRKGGTIASTIRAVDEAFAKAHGFIGLNVNLFESPQSSRDGLERLIAMVAQGTVTVPATTELRLADAPQALADVKSGKVAGKVVLEP